MQRILVDTNIVVDLLARRAPFWNDAQALFTLADKQQVALCVSALTMANTHYILARSLPTEQARNVLSRFKVLVTVLPMTDKIIELALASEFKDFEDGIQYFTALEHDLTAIITRNGKDFKGSILPVMNGQQFLGSFQR
jgi:predicted nucleic acid-binding protein